MKQNVVEMSVANAEDVRDDTAIGGCVCEGNYGECKGKSADERTTTV